MRGLSRWAAVVAVLAAASTAGTAAGAAAPCAPQIRKFEVTAGSMPTFVAAGPDASVWFTEVNGGRIGRITPAGAVTEFPLPTPDVRPEGVATGPDGQLWFTERAAGGPGRAVHREYVRADPTV